MIPYGHQNSLILWSNPLYNGIRLAHNLSLSSHLHKITFRLLTSSCHCIVREYFLSICVFNTDTFLQNHFQSMVGSAVDAKSVATSKNHVSWQLPTIWSSSFLFQSKSYCLNQNHNKTTPSRKAKGGESQPRVFQTHKDQSRSMPQAMWMALFPLSQAQHTEDPSESLECQPFCSTLSQQGQKLSTLFIYHDQPWKKFSKILREWLKISNIVVRQQIQEKIWEITWKLCEFMATAK